MSRSRLLVCGFALAALGLSSGCGAKDPSSLHITNLRVEEPDPGQPPDLLFAVDNGLSVSDSLISIASPDAESLTVGGTGAPVALPAREATRFEPGATYARLNRPRRQLEVGDEVQVTFTVGSVIQIRLRAPVVEPGATGPDAGHR